MFSLFKPAHRYLKQCQMHLETARMSALEHQVAAEHHAALAQMYRARVERLENELMDMEDEVRESGWSRKTGNVGQMPADGAAVAVDSPRFKSIS